MRVKTNICCTLLKRIYYNCIIAAVGMRSDIVEMIGDGIFYFVSRELSATMRYYHNTEEFEKT